MYASKTVVKQVLSNAQIHQMPNGFYWQHIYIVSCLFLFGNKTWWIQTALYECAIESLGSMKVFSLISGSYNIMNQNVKTLTSNCAWLKANCYRYGPWFTMILTSHIRKAKDVKFNLTRPKLITMMPRSKPNCTETTALISVDLTKHTICSQLTS